MWEAHHCFIFAFAFIVKLLFVSNSTNGQRTLFSIIKNPAHACSSGCKTRALEGIRYSEAFEKNGHGEEIV